MPLKRQPSPPRLPGMFACEPRQTLLFLFLSRSIPGSVGPRHGTGWGPHADTGELHSGPLTGGGWCWVNLLFFELCHWRETVFCKPPSPAYSTGSVCAWRKVCELPVLGDHVLCGEGLEEVCKLQEC